MISKEKFLNYISILEDYNNDIDDKNDALKVLFPSAYVYIENGKATDLILHLLGELTECIWDDNTGNYFSDIDWFYYEKSNNNSSISATHNNVEYNIRTWEDLYDFIVKSKE